MSAQEKLPMENNSSQRVKVYRLNDDGKWDDQGTGHVTVDYPERCEELGLFVVDEEDNETLLMHRISSDDIYRKQEDTIISWRDSEYSTELALSFQEPTGCSYIWEQIGSVQRNLNVSTLNNNSYHNITTELSELPAVELSMLPLILKTVVESGIADQMRVTELILHDIIDVYIDYLNDQSVESSQPSFSLQLQSQKLKPVYSFDGLFLYSIANLDKQTTIKLLKNAIGDYSKYSKIIFPLLLDFHWTVLVLNCDKGLWFFYNSLRTSPNTVKHYDLSCKMAHIISSLFKDEYNPKPAIDHSVHNVKDAPQQAQSSLDCGIVVCQIITQLFENEKLSSCMTKTEAMMMRAHLIKCFLSHKIKSWSYEKEMEMEQMKKLQDQLSKEIQ